MASAICGTRVFIAAESFSSHCARSSIGVRLQRFERTRRRLHRPIDIFRRAPRHACHGFFGRGRNDVDRLVAGGGLPRAVVVVLVVGSHEYFILLLRGHADFRKDLHRHRWRVRTWAAPPLKPCSLPAVMPCCSTSTPRPATLPRRRSVRRRSSRRPTSRARSRSKPRSTSRSPPSAVCTASSTPPASARPRRCSAETARTRSTCSRRRCASTSSARST